MEVYAEAFAALNLIINAVLLILCGAAAGLRARPWRIAAASALGCAYAFVCFAPGLAAFGQLAGKALCPLGMTLLAYGKRPIKQGLRLWAGFFIATFLLGGTGFGLIYLLGSGGFSAGIAIALAALGAGAMRFLLGSRRAAELSGCHVRIELMADGRIIPLDGYIDTGNQLTEPISALPVLVCRKPAAGIGLKSAHRYVSYKAAGGDGIMALYKPDAVYAVENDRRRRLGDAYVAFCDLSDTGFDVLVPPSVMKQ